MQPVGRLYDVDIRHVRVSPVRHDVRHRSHMWFVDLDRLPLLPRGLGWLARFEARDHLGDAYRSLRANVDAFLGERGIDLLGGRITMLTTARSFGYVFNPLTLLWCHDPSGRVVCIVAEVHNTYGQRHCYLLRPDDAGRADTEKAFYVSPFYPVDGHYRMSLPEPRDRLALTVTLHRPSDRPFTATVHGVGRPAYAHTVVAAALRRPLATWLSRGLITVHGLRLWRKRLPVQPRPDFPATRSVAQRLADLVRDGLGIEIGDVEAMREHYVRTVQHWAATLESRWDEFAALVGVQVARTWRLYLVGGALSFAEARMGVDQVLAVRPGRNGVSAMPAIRSPEVE